MVTVKHLEKQMNDTQETKTALEMSERDIENYSDDCDIERELKESDEVSWENGDKCAVQGIDALWIAKDTMDETQSIVAIRTLHGYTKLCFAANEYISKQETPEEKTARERDEAAYDLYMESKESMEPCMSKTTFIHTDNKEKELWLRIVDKTGYRKQ